MYTCVKRLSGEAVGQGIRCVGSGSFVCRWIWWNVSRRWRSLRRCRLITWCSSVVNMHLARWLVKSVLLVDEKNNEKREPRCEQWFPFFHYGTDFYSFLARSAICSADRLVYFMILLISISMDYLDCRESSSTSSRERLTSSMISSMDLFFANIRLAVRRSAFRSPSARPSARPSSWASRIFIS